MADKDDELIRTMFDEVAEVTLKPDGEVEVEVVETAVEDMENAVADFVKSANEFFDSNSRRCATEVSRAGIMWWRRLEWLAFADAKLKDGFCGRDRSRESIRLYHHYRLKLIAGRRYHTDA